MIEKLNKYNTSSLYAVIDKINEIIDFVNDTHIMRVKDGQNVIIDSCEPALNNLMCKEKTNAPNI